MDNFDLKKYLAEGRLLKENADVSEDTKKYLNSKFEIYLEGGDSFKEKPGETHVFTMEGDDEQYKDDYRFNEALKQLQQNPIVLDYNKDYVGDYGEVTAEADANNIKISFIVPEMVNNRYVVKDEEDEDFYFIDKQKALDYLSQFDSEEVDAKQFIDDDEGWGEFEQYLEDVEQMTDEELEDAMRQEMSFYYYSNGDSI